MNQGSQGQPVRINGGLFYNTNMRTQSSPQLTGNIKVTPEFVNDLFAQLQAAQQSGGEVTLDLAGWWKKVERGPNVGQDFISVSCKVYTKQPRQGQGYGGGQGYPQQAPPQPPQQSAPATPQPQGYPSAPPGYGAPQPPQAAPQGMPPGPPPGFEDEDIPF